MARQIEAFKLRTELTVDNAKFAAGMKASEKDVDKLGQRFNKLGPEIDKALKGKELGTKFGQQFSSSATALITGSFDSLGTTLGSVIGTAIAPGIGTAIGSTIGSAADAAFAKISGPIMQTIAAGIELNKELERTKVEYTTFTGSEKEAVQYLERLKKLAIDTGTDFKWVMETSESLYDFTGNLKLSNTILTAAIDKAADIGGGPVKIRAIADALGLIAQNTDLDSKALMKLSRMKVDVPRILAQATGLDEKAIQKLIQQKRLRGDVAARLIAEGLQRESGGFAAKIAETTTYGAEERFKVLTSLRAAEGTESATRGIGDFYRKADELLSSDKAKQFVQFIDQTTNTLINFVEKGLSAGVNLTKGLADGIVSGDAFRAVGSAVTSLGDYTANSLKSFFEIESPSKWSAREIGVPLGQGLAAGIGDGFSLNFKKQTTEEIVATLEGLLQDPRVQAFFEAIRKAEGGAPNRIVGGRTVSDLSRHPNIVGLRTEKGPSTAFGNYQITGSNWYGRGGRPGLQQRLNLPDASAHSQLLAAALMFAERDGGAGIKALLAGDIDKAMHVAAKDWTSTPGSTIGGGRQLSPQKWMGYFNQALSLGGKSIDASNPLPVYFPDSMGGAASLFSHTPDSRGGASTMFSQGQNLKGYTLALDDADGAVVDLKVQIDDLVTSALVPGTRQFRELINSVTPAMRAITPLIGAEKQHAATSIALTKEYQRAAREELIQGMSILDQLSGAIGQIAGMMPQQTVGKKRGLFSKILGFAAPFLSFIPGVGPILSQIAGIASNAAAGNWAVAISGVAGGFASGGVFRSSGGGSSGSGSGAATGNRGSGLIPRAAGGPGYRGRTYWVGENGPEPFMAPSNGYFLNHRDAMHAMGGGGGDSGMSAAIERLNAFLARLEGMRPHDVVRLGARGMLDAMDQNAGLIRAHGQRLRLS